MLITISSTRLIFPNFEREITINICSRLLMVKTFFYYPQWLTKPTPIGANSVCSLPSKIFTALASSARDFSNPPRYAVVWLADLYWKQPKQSIVARHRRILLLLIPTLKTTTSRHVLESRPSDSEALNAAILWTGNYLWQYIGFSCRTKNSCAIFHLAWGDKHPLRHWAIHFPFTFAVKCIRPFVIGSLLLQ